MANDEVLGPRKTMFVLVIVVGCFAVLWPRILSPLVVGNSADQLKPNKLDRDAGKPVFLTLAPMSIPLDWCEIKSNYTPNAAFIGYLIRYIINMIQMTLKFTKILFRN